MGTEESDSGVNMIENLAVDLSQENSKHLVDEAAVEVVGDTLHKYVQLGSTPAGSEYHLAIDPVLDQTALSETASLQPPAMADEDKKILDLYVSEVEQRLNQKLVLRQENQDVVSLRPDESYFSKLDSSLKKEYSICTEAENIYM